jgi:mRNA interferase RelE/StbE
VSLQVDYDERAIDQAAAFLDDPRGMRAVLDAIDQLADDPRPAGSFPYGSPDLRRLRLGRYRVLYEITEDAIAVRHIAPRHQELTGAEAWSSLVRRNRTIAGRRLVSSEVRVRSTYCRWTSPCIAQRLSALAPFWPSPRSG